MNVKFDYRPVCLSSYPTRESHPAPGRAEEPWEGVAGGGGDLPSLMRSVVTTLTHDCPLESDIRVPRSPFWAPDLPIVAANSICPLLKMQQMVHKI